MDGFDSLGRRLRFLRRPAGKQIMHTERDTQILYWLYRYRYLRASHLENIFLPRSPKRFIERLGDLYHETGYINRLKMQPALLDAHATSMLYEISPRGIDFLTLNGALPHRAVTFSRRSSRSYSPQLLHTMMIIETLLAIECTAMKEPGQRFVPVDEILARAPPSTANARNPLAIPVTLEPNAGHSIVRKRVETVLIPDALYGIEYEAGGEKRYRFWALECER
ncbi:MAG: replication-relaxation family protein, partial [Gimesia chilikensis]